MKSLTIIIGIGVSVAIIASVFFIMMPSGTSHCVFCPAVSNTDQPLEITDVSTEPQMIHVGSSFLIYANVYNPNPYSVYVNGGCFSPLSLTFDKNVDTKRGISCFAILKQEIPSKQQARLQGPGSGVVYNATGMGNTTATITVTYQGQNKTLTTTTTKIITIS
ncbi:MAG TPA: hypothetical protein VJ571_01780 [Candidatus Nitrosotalea sp.]|nr:hypothetical protein [Candidatus Nitrosotalea sp.]